MQTLPEMPKHTLSLAPFFDSAITTPRLTVKPLEKYCAPQILRALKATNGFASPNNEFRYYSDETWKKIRNNIDDDQNGLKFIWKTLLPDIKSRRSEALFLGLYSAHKQELVGILAAWFDDRKWLRISPFVFPEHQKSHYAKEVYESIGEALGEHFNDGIIYAVISPDNNGSIALFQSLGFEEVTPSRENVHVPHLRRDIMSLGFKTAYSRNFSVT